MAPLVVPPATLESLAATLAPAERARASRCRDPGVARRFSVAHGWLRHVLGAASGTAPAAVRLADGAGKPRLARPAGIHFNLSHAGDLALIAVTGRRVGVDVEHVDRGAGGLEAAGLVCTPAETAALDRLPTRQERADAFLCMWTAKEAYLKATGAGLTVAPDTVETGAVDAAGARPVRVTSDAGPPRWWVRQLRPVPGYVGAVAAEGPDWLVELRHVGDLPLAVPSHI